MTNQPAGVRQRVVYLNRIEDGSPGRVAILGAEQARVIGDSSAGNGASGEDGGTPPSAQRETDTEADSSADFDIAGRSKLNKVELLDAVVRAWDDRQRSSVSQHDASDGEV
jgi:hypothetical protein